ncbi:MAG: universal stress protein [Bacillota bacterium]
MFEKILFPTAGSALAEKIAEVIVKLIKEKPDRQVTILNVVQGYQVPGEVEFEMEAKGVHLDDFIQKNVEASIGKAVEIFKNNGVPYTVEIKMGDPVKNIVETAKNMECDLVVIGYHGETTLTDFIFKGNTMSRIIDECVSPVMVIK